eukprot:m.334600 g.334600  ORF g.334600 m.334600 type:complete len:596 (-) comp17395_c0_seq1:103-1890(-)
MATKVISVLLLLVVAVNAAPKNVVVSAPQGKLHATTVGIRQSEARLAELEKEFWAVATPGNAKFRKYITDPTVLWQFLAAEDEDIQFSLQWLEQQGCSNCVLRAHTKDAAQCDCPDLSDTPKPSVLDFLYQPSDKGTINPILTSETVQRKRKQPSALPPNHGTPSRQKESYGIPADIKADHASNLQEVWGCGTFGVNKTELGMFYKQYCAECSVDDVIYETKNHGKEFGDNYVEGTLDTTYITSLGPGVKTINSNTNTSMATEEGEGQGIATVYAMDDIAARKTNFPLVLSLSLGSLGYDSCDYLCTEYSKSKPDGAYKECHDFIQTQRQVCLYASYDQMNRINNAYKVMGLRGATVLGASGDGGSHWLFGKFSPGKRPDIALALDEISCKRQSPVFPANSPYVVAVGGLTWVKDNSKDVQAWDCGPGAEGGSGGGFSDMWPRPPYQDTAVTAYLNKVKDMDGFATGYNKTGRAYPDLSAFMDGVPLCFDERCDDSIVGGTSASTPTMGGIFSLVNDIRLKKGLAPLGFVVPIIWKVAMENPGEAFKDITVGNTSCGCDNGYIATEGWDPLTGWGQPVWEGFTKYFADDSWLIQA